MNVGQLRTAFESLIDDTVDNSILLVWLDEAQEDLAMDYGKVTKWTVEATADTEIDLPADYLSTAGVRKDGEDYTAYSVTEWGTIIFPNSDTFDVYYHQVPAKLTPNDDNATPEIHTILHTPMYVYAAAMFFDRESGGDSEETRQASKYMARYQAMKKDRVAKLNSRSNVPQAVRVVV